VSKGKPDPEVYIKAAAALGYDPRNSVVFEDSIAGVEAGKNAGSKVVGITTTHTKDELAGTDYMIDDFSDLDPKELITKLFPEE
jgi:beta-phosphoglucomutase